MPKRKLSRLTRFKKTILNTKKAHALIALVFVVGFAAIGYRQLHQSHALSSARSTVVWNATAQLGQTEYNSQVMLYTDGNQEDWCADFVSWVFLKSGHRFVGGINDWRIKVVYRQVAGIQNLRDYFKYFHAYREASSGYHGAPGDVVLFTRNGADHAGIIVETTSAGMKTVEGNRSDKVGLGLYTWGDSRIDGYGVWLP